MTSYNRRDVVPMRWLDTMPAGGKVRPAHIVQADGLDAGLSQLVLAGITSNMARGGQPFRLVIPVGSAAIRGTGLRHASVVMADNLLTVHLRDIDRRIGRLADMTLMDAALRAALGL